MIATHVPAASNGKWRAISTAENPEPTSPPKLKSA